MKRILYAFLVVLCAASSAYSQITSCAQALRYARSIYEQGRLRELPEVLDGCLKADTKASKKEGKSENTFTLEEKVEAYKLLCLSYIYLEEPEKADAAMLSLLRTEPYFTVNKDVDPAEFIALYNSFRTNPVYRIGATLGVNATQPNVVNSIRISAPEGEISGEYKYLVGFQFGASADVPLKWFQKGNIKPFTLHADALYQQKTFEFTETGNRGNNLENTLTGTETQSWISLPVTLQYNFLQKKYNPYISVGGSADYLLTNELVANKLRQGTTSVEERAFKPNREPLNLSVVAGAGVKIPIGRGFAVFELRFTYGLTEVSTEENVFSNLNSNLDYTYSADAAYRLSSLSLTGAYLFNKFNPKKLNRRR